MRVMVEASRAAAASALAAVGGTVELADASLTQALVAPQSLEALATSAGIRQVRPPAIFRADASEGVQATNAQAWQNAVPAINGNGVKVAIIDLGFGNPASDPPNSQRVDLCPGQIQADPHGQAVADIVHDMAPSAQLFLICVNSELTLKAAENFVLANNIRIVNHSVGWYGTSRGDGSGDPNSPNAIVADARAHGVLWINAAGNNAQSHWAGTFSDPDGNDFENFSGGDELNRVVVPPGQTDCVVMTWDAWPVTSQDFDVFLVDTATGQIVNGGLRDQSRGPLDPEEDACYANTTGATVTLGLLVNRYSATSSPRLDIWWLGSSPLQYQTTSGSVVEPASSPNALGVGAVCFSTGALEPYSSQGPTVDGRMKP